MLAINDFDAMTNPASLGLWTNELGYNNRPFIKPHSNAVIWRGMIIKILPMKNDPR
jgi:hypothetical protein